MTDYGPYTAEEGTAGATVTTGTAWDNILGGPTFSATGKSGGALGYRWNTSGAAAAWRGYKQFTSSSQLACRVNFTINTLIASRSLVWIINSGFATNAQFGLDGTSKPIIRNAAGTTLATGAAALTAGVVYTMEIQTAPGTTTTDGTIKCQLYAQSTPGTLLLNYTATNVNAGAGSTILRGQVGSNTSETIDVTFDDILWRTGTLTPVSAAAVVLPVANAGADVSSIAPGAVVAQTGSASSGSGTGYTYQWRIVADPSGTVALTGATTATVSFTAPTTMTGLTVRLGLTVTDSAGNASAEDTVDFAVRRAFYAKARGGVWFPSRRTRL